jgi:replicative DNA helicase
MYQEYKHYNVAIERVIIGICLHEPDAFLRSKEMLSPLHFYDECCRLTFQQMVDMWDSGMSVDLVTVDHYLNKNGHVSKFNNSVSYFLTQSMMAVGTSAHLIKHCLLLREMFISRELYRVKMQAINDDLDPMEAAGNLKAELEKAMELNVDDDWITMAEAIAKLQRHMDEVTKTGGGVPTGFAEFDRMTFGLQPGGLHIVAARPGVGKSAFATSLAINASKKGFKVGIITLEMPTEQVVGRMSSIYSDVEFWRIYRNMFKANEERNIVLADHGSMAKLPVFFTDKTSITPEQIRAKAHRLKKTRGVDIIILDYLQLVDIQGKKNDNREREIAKLSRELKTLAMDLNIPVVALAQLNREAEKDKRPRLYHLRESGSLEQDADMVILLHRDAAKGISNNEMGESTAKIAEIIVDKNRNGETFTAKIFYDSSRMLFHDPSQTNTPF